MNIYLTLFAVSSLHEWIVAFFKSQAGKHSYSLLHFEYVIIL